MFPGDEFFFTTKVGWGFGASMIDETKDKINIFLKTVGCSGRRDAHNVVENVGE